MSLLTPHPFSFILSDSWEWRSRNSSLPKQMILEMTHFWWHCRNQFGIKGFKFRDTHGSHFRQTVKKKHTKKKSSINGWDRKDHHNLKQRLASHFSGGKKSRRQVFNLARQSFAGRWSLPLVLTSISVVWSQHRQDMNKWVWLISSKTLFSKPGRRPQCALYVDQWVSININENLSWYITQVSPEWLSRKIYTYICNI